MSWHCTGEEISVKNKRSSVEVKCSSQASLSPKKKKKEKKKPFEIVSTCQRKELKILSRELSPNV